MTEPVKIGATVPRVVYHAATLTTDFPVPFPFDDADDLLVTWAGIGLPFTVVAGEVSTGINVTATVRLNVPIAGDVVIERSTKLQQDAVFPGSGTFRTPVLNREISREWMALQDAKLQAERGLRVPVGELISPIPGAAARANKLGGFNTQGDFTLYDIAIPGVDGAFTAPGVGGVIRSVNSKLADSIVAWDYGLIGPAYSGAVNAATLGRAIAAAALFGFRHILLPSGQLPMNPLVAGNGSAASNVATVSTVNNIELVGAGASFLRLGIGGLAGAGTIFVYAGTAGGTQLQIAGPAVGISLTNIGFNGGGFDGTGVGTAGCLLDIRSGSRGRFENLTFANVQSGGSLVKLGCVSAESITGGGDGAVIGCEGNHFENLRGVVGAGANGISLGGYTGSAANGFDSVRNTFHNTYMLVSLTGGTGIRVAYADQNTFHNTSMTGFGTDTQNHAAVRYVGTPTVPNAYPFPQNIVFTGQTDFGQYLFTSVDETAGPVGPGLAVQHATMLDRQYPPRGNTLRAVRMQVQEAGAFPYGGYVTDLGGSINERAGRNRFRNSQFLRATLGTTFASLTNNQQLANGWVIIFNGTPSLSAQILTPPFTDPLVPGARVLRLNCTAVNGMTSCLLLQNIGSVRDTDGRQVTASATMRLPFGGTNQMVAGRADQFFGTGGSPSAQTATPLYQGDGALTSAWRRISFTGHLPNLIGKTQGTGLDDFLYAGFSFPLSTFVIDINAPQFETAAADTAYERLTPAMEALLAATLP